jgi:hypothetical protein
MSTDRNDLREEILAVLAAHRELDGSADEELVAGLLERIDYQPVERSRRADLRAAYDALIPVKPSTVVTIAVAQGAVLLVLGEMMIRNAFNDYYAAQGGLIPGLATLGILWIAEVIATVAVLAALVPRDTSERVRQRRSPASRPRRTPRVDVR